MAIATINGRYPKAEAITPAHNGALPTVLKSEHDAEVEWLNQIICARNREISGLDSVNRAANIELESLRALNRELVEALNAAGGVGLRQSTDFDDHDFVMEVESQIRAAIEKGAKA